MTKDQVVDLQKIGRVLRPAKKLATRYRALTGRPLGITGEVAEYEAARLLGLDLAPAGQAGFDAVRKTGRKVERLQVKGRCVTSSNPGQRVGRIDLKKHFDAVLLVLLDPNLEPTAIYKAGRRRVIQALTKPGSKARNERGALSVSKFKSIGTLVWSNETAKRTLTKATTRRSGRSWPVRG
jgi:hypothetical protein